MKKTKTKRAKTGTPIQFRPGYRASMLRLEAISRRFANGFLESLAEKVLAEQPELLPVLKCAIGNFSAGHTGIVRVLRELYRPDLDKSKETS